MIIRSGGKKRVYGLNEPLRHESHKKPVTRRDFLAQGFVTGSATVVAPTLLGMLTMPQFANATLSGTMNAIAATECGISSGGSDMMPFICFDMAGGGNIAGSNVLVGQQGGQMDFLTTAGYAKLGLPGNMVPNASVTGSFIDQTLGLAFHSDSAILRGIMSKITVTSTAPRVNGAVIPARSENDTGNNPHNPMYGIAKTGARGDLVTLIGSQNSVSGGNSLAPMMMIDPTNQPTKISSAADARSLVDTGDLSALFPGATGQADTNAVMESIAKISKAKVTTPGVSTLLDTPAGAAAVTSGPLDDAAKNLLKCSYAKAAYLTDRYSGGPNTVDPTMDPAITGTGFATPIFTTADFGDTEFAKTAAIMKLVIGGYAGAGTISMGGFDYHTGDRMTGEGRDERLGKCIGACLEYAARINRPVMIYVFSDGSVASNGMVDNSVGGRGKLGWGGDNQGTASSFFLVYNPIGRPVVSPTSTQQLGWFTGAGDVMASSSPAGNSVLNLVDLVVLNYLALQGQQSRMQTLYPGSAFASSAMIDAYSVFAPLSTSTPPPPPPPPPATITACTTNSISANHGHTLTVTPADVAVTTANVVKTLTTGNGHTHTVTLTPTMLTTLQLGQAGPGISVTTDPDATGHMHTCMVTCVGV
jgi:hypothetical protein